MPLPPIALLFDLIEISARWGAYPAMSRGWAPRGHFSAYWQGPTRQHAATETSAGLVDGAGLHDTGCHVFVVNGPKRGDTARLKRVSTYPGSKNRHACDRSSGVWAIRSADAASWPRGRCSSLRRGTRPAATDSAANSGATHAMNWDDDGTLGCSGSSSRKKKNGKKKVPETQSALSVAGAGLVCAKLASQGNVPE